MASLAVDLENNYEGEIGSIALTTDVYTVQLKSDIEGMVREVEYLWSTRKPSGVERLVKKRTYTWMA
jgi:hypothetical protein